MYIHVYMYVYIYSSVWKTLKFKRQTFLSSYRNTSESLGEGEMLRGPVFPQIFRVLPNFQEYSYLTIRLWARDFYEVIVDEAERNRGTPWFVDVFLPLHFASGQNAVVVQARLLRHNKYKLHSIAS